jgi:hypothetical protein
VTTTTMKGYKVTAIVSMDRCLTRVGAMYTRDLEIPSDKARVTATGHATPRVRLNLSIPLITVDIYIALSIFYPPMSCKLRKQESG